MTGRATSRTGRADSGSSSGIGGTPIQHYQTFDSSPPKSKGYPLPTEETDAECGGSRESHDTSTQEDSEETSPRTPLPKRQLLILAVIALCEQTALNSLSPYLPHMVSRFPGITDEKVGIAVGSVASAFALAQVATNFFWGWISDWIGRKPVILLGTLFTAVCFILFGFCTTLGQAVAVQAAMGALNGNPGVVPTCLGEITDRTNQPKAFTYLPVLFGIGAITGPIVGGLLVSDHPWDQHFPYLLPNMFSALILLLEFVATSMFLQESLQHAIPLPRIGRRIKSLFSWMWQFTDSAYPSYIRRAPNGRQADASRETDETRMSLLSIIQRDNLLRRNIWNRDTAFIMGTYFIFSLCNIAYNALYPIFGQASAPTGRSLTPEEIGLSLAFAGGATILFQLFVFEYFQNKIGIRSSYRASFFIFALCFFAMPFVAYKGEHGEHTILLGFELCSILLLRTIASVGGLTSSLLLVRP